MAGKRERVVSVIMSDSEKRRLENFAKRQGLSLSGAARMLVLQGVGKK